LAVHNEAARRNASERERKSASPGAQATTIRKAGRREEIKIKIGKKKKKEREDGPSL
jgi:hypothetical protein